MCISGLRSLNSFTPFTLLLKVDGTGPKKKKYRNTLTNVSPLSVRLSTSLTFASYITRSSSCLRTAALYHFILPLLFKFLPCSDGASTHTHTDQNVWTQVYFVMQIVDVDFWFPFWTFCIFLKNYFTVSYKYKFLTQFHSLVLAGTHLVNY